MRSCIFDTRIVDADARSYRNKAPKAVLRQHEREKTWKYKKACLERCRDFTPLCYTADGMAGREARNAASPGLPFGVKMEAPTQPDDILCAISHMSLALALVWANSLLIRDSREKRNQLGMSRVDFSFNGHGGKNERKGVCLSHQPAEIIDRADGFVKTKRWSHTLPNTGIERASMDQAFPCSNLEH
jgi:hypothetical protein